MNSFANATFAVSIVFSMLALCAVLARLCSRKIKNLRLGADDWIIVVDMILVLGLAIMTAWASVHGGIGLSLVEMNPDVAVAFLKQTWANELICTTAIGTVKISVLCFYKRIFATAKFRRVANVFIALAACWTIAFFCTLCFNLIPIPLEWSLVSLRPHNLNFAAMLISMGALDTALDVAILSLPLPVIRRLNMSTQRKWLVAGIFSLGAFCIVASITRLVYITKFVRVYGADDAFSGVTSEIMIWSTIEPCVSVIAACLPTLGPLFTGGRSLETFLARLRSYIPSSLSSFSINERRKTSHDPPSADPVLSTAEGRMAWQKFRGDSTTTDVELGSPYSAKSSADGIRIDRSFGSEVEQRTHK